MPTKQSDGPESGQPLGADTDRASTTSSRDQPGADHHADERVVSAGNETKRRTWRDFDEKLWQIERDIEIEKRAMDELLDRLRGRAA